MKKIILMSVLGLISIIANARWQPSTIKSNTTKDTIVTINSNTLPDPLNHPFARILNHNSPTFYIGAGFASPSTTLQTNAYCTNLIGFKINMFLPGSTSRIIQNFSWGINLGNEYFYSNQYQFNNLPVPNKIVGQKAPPTIVSNNPKQTGFKFEAGLQFNILFAKRFVISPILNIGSFYIEQQAFIVQQTTIMNSGNSGIKRYDLLNKQMQSVYPVLELFGFESSEDGRAFLFSPKLRLHYYFSNWVALWAEANYVLGPNVYYNTTKFYPQGTPDQNGEYTLSQMDAGKYFKENTTTVRYNSFGLNFGIALTIPTQEQLMIVNKL